MDFCSGILHHRYDNQLFAMAAMNQDVLPSHQAIFREIADRPDEKASGRLRLGVLRISRSSKLGFQ